MRPQSPFHAIALFCALTCAPAAFPLFAQEKNTAPDFAHQIAPILKQHCAGCHTGDKKKGGFSFDSHPNWLAGSENGEVFNAKDPHKSKVLSVIFSEDPDVVMPPPAKDRARPTQAQLELLKSWILSGAQWESGFAFTKPSYKAPVKPRLPEIPPTVDGRTHVLDRLLDAYIAKNKLPLPPLADDATFARRLHLDLLGLLPEPDALQRFLDSKDPEKRARLVDSLLERKTDYTEHWLTFWNDLLRNDYGGTGFITGGRKQVSSWLYDALYNNKPYDAMVRELVNPSPDTEGYAEGITWRGTVSASQTREVQFAQSISQSFLGLNLKCASCHDSFVDQWKLTDAYGLAAVYAEQPVEIARCEKLTGKTAIASWPFPEIGQIDAAAPRAVRLKQLADLMTHPDNGWFARTIANRLWARLLGRGLVHPVDAMGTQPWSEEILDYLGWHLAQSHYDLKETLRLITTSRAYQSQTIPRAKDDETGAYVFKGPRAKRITAEQFIDLIWQLTGSAPVTQDAPVRRGEASPELLRSTTLGAQPITHPQNLGEPTPSSEATKPASQKGKQPLSVFRKLVDLPSKPVRAAGIVTGTPAPRIIVNGALQKAPQASTYGTITDLQIGTAFVQGPNVVVLVQNAPTPGTSSAWMELELTFTDGTKTRIATDPSWECADGFSEDFVKGNKFTLKTPEFANAAWSPASPTKVPVVPDMQSKLLHSFVWAIQPRLPARAALLKSDLLMRTLGRPNRDQIVTSRPNELSTLEALDLSAGKRLFELITLGSKNIAQRKGLTPETLTNWLFLHGLSRAPQAGEREAALETLGQNPSADNIADLLWTVCMLPEFELIR